MRKFLAFLVVVLLVLAAVPFVDGYLFRQYYLNLLTNVNNTKDTKVTVLNYQLGWLTSYAKLYIESTQSPSQNKFPNVGLTLEETISHGPFVYNPISNRWMLAQAMIESHFSLPEPINSLLLGQNREKGILQVATLVTFNNNFINKINIPSIHIEMPAGKLNWQGLQGDTIVYTTDQLIKRVQSNVAIGAFSAQSMFGALQMEKISVRSDVTRQPVGLWNGSYVFSMPDFSYMTPDQKNYSLKDFNVTHQFNTKGTDFYNTHLQISLNKLIVPDYDVNSMKMGFDLNELSAQGVIHFCNQMANLPQGNLTENEINQYKEIFLKLLTPATVLNENIAINTSLGNMLSDGTFYFSGPMKTFEELQKAISFKINIRASIAFVNKWIELHSTPHDPEAPVESASAPTSLDQTIDNWVAQNRISMSTSLQLKDLVKRHLDVKSFSVNLEQFVLKKEISEDLIAQLKMEYAQAENAKQNPALPAPQQTATTPAEKNKQQLNDWVKQGYIIQDKEDYVTTITREQGVLKANGVEIVM